MDRLRKYLPTDAQQAKDMKEVRDKLREFEIELEFCEEWLQMPLEFLIDIMNDLLDIYDEGVE